MARNFVPLAASFIFISLYLTPAITGMDAKFGRRLSPLKLGIKNEKLTHFKVYWQDVLGGPKPTVLRIIKSPKNATNAFGAVSMIDDALTMGPKLDSKLVGRAQGFYAFSGKEQLSLTMVMNFVFMEGKYNGSTVSILGRNEILTKMREMPIIGGSGLFRFARGYVQARTYMFDLKSGSATVEYNVYVMHY